ncbi:MAG: ATP-binding protein [Erysipelotrichaceae bacterium]|uniref:ATP-binding protein n=1 Tax=Floccifex sp. TaxID=2815810 RepID=UPI002A756828|nr:ATP-binding protein [Floccifex sp.]MDD7280822.1 ATP-binding protein [Erysipelotrichaceae bacterium]MDY2958141.1 ATP-binding protein [Floccifex sp.]
MIIRKKYLNKLISWKDHDVIKVVTGIRRCGKSTLLKQYQDYLRDNNVMEEQIISINFEDLKFEELLDYRALYEYVENKMIPDKKMYIFLDEIQKVPSFEKAVDSLYIKNNVDVYITGSNAYMLSSDLSTLLSGRYVEISMLPLSFKEFYEVKSGNKEEAFNEYLKYGGFPYLMNMPLNDEQLNMYLEGIYNTVIVKDIEERENKKYLDPNKRKITNIVLLKTIARYLASTVGSIISVKNVTGYLTSSGRKVSASTVDDYMEALQEAFIFYPVERFDISGKKILKTLNKWYIVDLGLRNYMLPKERYDLGFSLENIVYFELLRRGYRVCVGKTDTSEIDFVAQKNDEINYFQVTANMMDQTTFDRELAPLKSIKDNYRKIVLTLDKFTLGNYDGIEVVNAIDWLLEE